MDTAPAQTVPGTPRFPEPAAAGPPASSATSSSLPSAFGVLPSDGPDGAGSSSFPRAGGCLPPRFARHTQQHPEAEGSQPQRQDHGQQQVVAVGDQAPHEQRHDPRRRTEHATDLRGGRHPTDRSRTPESQHPGSPAAWADPRQKTFVPAGDRIPNGPCHRPLRPVCVSRPRSVDTREAVSLNPDRRNETTQPWPDTPLFVSASRSPPECWLLPAAARSTTRHRASARFHCRSAQAAKPCRWTSIPT